MKSNEETTYILHAYTHRHVYTQHACIFYSTLSSRAIGEFSP